MQLHPQLGNDLIETYRRYSNEGRHLKEMELKAIYEKLISKLGDCYLIIDALNDVVDESGHGKLLNTVINKSTRALVTSRHMNSIEKLFCFEETPSSRLGESSSTSRKFNATRMEIEAARGDLLKYFESRIDDSVHLARIVEEHKDLRREIVDTVVNKAKGM